MTGRMLAGLLDRFRGNHLWIGALACAILLGAVAAGYVASPFVLALPIAALGGIALLQWPILGLLGLPLAALAVPLSLGTGSGVALNPATLLVPAVVAVWVLDMMRRGDVHLVSSRANRPLLLFLATGLLSLVVGIGTWDPTVPRSGSFLVVQLAQWAIFAFSAAAYWLNANLVHDEARLRRLTFLFLACGGSLAILRVLPGSGALVSRVATAALTRSSFWMLLAAVAGGQLLFHRRLSLGWRLFLLLSLAAVLVYAFYVERIQAANWVGVCVVAGVLAWLRFPRLRWPVVVLLVVLTVSGALSSTVYDFAGGEAEWQESGGSRLALIGRVVEVTMRNPITGLGPAAYRVYAGMEPLLYGRAYYLHPLISSHNNYVDLFAHVGLLGLAFFAWFVAEVTRLGLRLRAHYTEGFAAGYLNAVLAAGVGALVLMALADWILPFVYNVGFPGFQASVLVWMFLGGLVALDAIASGESKTEGERAA